MPTLQTPVYGRAPAVPACPVPRRPPEHRRCHQQSQLTFACVRWDGSAMSAMAQGRQPRCQPPYSQPWCRQQHLLSLQRQLGRPSRHRRRRLHPRQSTHAARFGAPKIAARVRVAAAVTGMGALLAVGIGKLHGAGPDLLPQKPSSLHCSKLRWEIAVTGPRAQLGTQRCPLRQPR